MAVRGVRGGHTHAYESKAFSLDHTKKFRIHGSIGNSKTADQ